MADVPSSEVFRRAVTRCRSGGGVVLRVGRGCVRPRRIGGDEFAVLAVQTDRDAARAERDRLSDLLRAAGVPASVGAATRSPHGGLPAAWQRADTDMYRAKNTRPRFER